MTFRIAVVQPIANPIEQASKNVADAEAFIARAAADGVHVVCLPETYPGPWRMPAAFDPGPAMAAAAARNGVHVVYGTIAPIPGSNGAAHNLIYMAYPDGRTVQYRRTHPNGPWISTGGEWWEFQYVAGDEFPVFDTEHGKVGLAMCSEVYMPEVARALALRQDHLHAGPHRQAAAMGDLAQPDLGPRHRKPRSGGDHAESVQPCRARSRHGRGPGGNPVREHRGRAVYRGCRPRAPARDAHDHRWCYIGERIWRQTGRAGTAMATARTA
jgi:hypothetical protein